MVTDCLENLANLREQGVDEEVIRNVAGLVYVGKPEFCHTHLNLYLTSACSNGGDRSYLHVLRRRSSVSLGLFRQTQSWARSSWQWLATHKS